MRKSKAELRDLESRGIAQQMKRLITGYRTLLEHALEAEGITLAHLRMLHALEERPGMSAAEIARSCFVTPQSMQAVVTRGVRSGWIQRSPSPDNHRVLVASLTAAGMALLKRGTELSADINRDIWATAKLSEMQLVNTMLATAAQRLQPGLNTLHARSAAQRKTA